MDYIIIRINNVYYIKYMVTGELLNPCKIDDLRQIRDLINNSNMDQIEEYKLREQRILEILNCNKTIQEENQE